MTSVEPTRRERRKEETKERIFQAALSLFTERGFAATTVEEICTRADVAKGTFFNHFPRKEATLGYLAERWLTEAEQRAAAILAGSGAAWEKLLTMFTEFAGFYERERGLAGALVQEWTRQLYAGDEVWMRWQDLGARIVRELQEHGEVRADVDPRRANSLLQGVYHGTVQQWVETAEPPFSLTSELRMRLVLVMEGLTPCRPGGR